LSVEAFQAIVIESSVTDTTRRFVGVEGGVRSLAAADAAGARTANDSSTTATARLAFMTLPPNVEIVRYTRGHRDRFWPGPHLACET
jgi:hypothetical protein